MRRRLSWIALAALAATLLVVARDDRDPPAAPAGAQEAAVNRLAPRASGTPAVHQGPATPPGSAVSPALPRVAPLAPAFASIDRTPLGELGDGDAARLVEDPPWESPSEASDSDAPRAADDPASEAHAAPEPDILERDEPRQAHAPGRPPF